MARRPGGTAIGTEKFAVPVNRSGLNDSPSPLIAPPPLGSEMTLPPAEASVDDPAMTCSLRARARSREAGPAATRLGRRRPGDPAAGSQGGRGGRSAGQHAHSVTWGTTGAVRGGPAAFHAGLIGA